MGICGSTTDPEVERLNNQLQRELLEDRKKDRQTKKLLLLGTGNCGKSTIFKQLIQIHGKGIEDRNLIDYAKAVYSSIVEQMRVIISQAKMLKFEFDDKTLDSIEYFEKLPREVEIDGEIAQNISVLWKNKWIRKTYEERSNVSVVQSFGFFCDEIARIGKKDYVPTINDIILVRTPTTGVTEVTLTIKNNQFRIYDVGGERSERSKWIHCFDTVTAVIYVCSLNCYDQMLYEDDRINCMHESLNLFDEICNSKYFFHTTMILFLNKSDLFRIKIDKKSLNVCFPEYKCEKIGKEYQNGIDFIRRKFVEKNRSKYKQIYTHVICATDKGSIERVMHCVVPTCVNNVFEYGGLL